MRLEVWAPRARTAEVVLSDGRRLPMSALDRGVFVIDDAGVVPGTRYTFSLDGGPPLPDPRSRSQPEGVHGPSEAIDLSAFRWSDGGWAPPPLRDSVIYELHVGTFTPEGTFDAAVARLDILLDLGITAVELMPVAEFPGRRGWGYDGVDLFAPYHGYGGAAGLCRLVDACHRRGLAVILDVVYNHLGPDGNRLSEYGPYFTDRYRTPWGQAWNYDGPGSDMVRDLVVENARQWLRDFHVDGLRLDAVHAIHDASAVPLLEQLSASVDQLEAELGRRLWLIAETDRNDPRVVTPREQGGLGIDAQWADEFHHTLHTWLTGERNGYYADFDGLADLSRALTSPYVYTGQYSRHRDRLHGRPPLGLQGERLVVSVQNHDQVGNRARGERLAQLVGWDRLRIAAALLLTSPYVPLLFAGEEWGASTPFQYFTDHEPELGRLVTAGRRREFASFGWAADDIPDPQAEFTFLASRLRWEERDAGEHAALLDWHRRLIRLRRSEPDLGCGDPGANRVRIDPGAGWLALERGSHLITVNAAGVAAEIAAPGGIGAEPRLASSPEARWRDDSVWLPAGAVAIWRRSG